MAISVFKELFHFDEELFFFAPAYFYFHAVAHNDSAAFSTGVFFYMHEIDEKRFMYTEENGITQ